MGTRGAQRPGWDALFETALSQDGLFTTRQAREAGYSPQLLVHHVAARRFVRVRRGIYRLVHFPASAHEDLITAWLWSEREGVVSHQSALALHALSDVLPRHTHLTLPEPWRTRRVKAPGDVVLHFADLPQRDRTWHGVVPMTTSARTLSDCARENFAPELLRQAAIEAVSRGLVKHSDLIDVRTALEPFGGLAG